MIKLASASYDALDYILNDRIDELSEVVTVLEKRAKNVTIPDLDEVYQMDPSEFALRMNHSSGEEMRKFAMSTKDLTEINLHLLSRNVDWLPEPIVKTAATNLVRAALDYKIAIPDNLEEYKSEEFVHNVVDISSLDKEASFLNIDSHNDSTEYLLDGKYPVTFKDDITKAAEYFDKYHHMFTGEEKITYSKNLIKAAQSFNEPTNDLITKYASLNTEEINENFDLKMKERTSYLKDNFSDMDVYNSISEKVASNTIDAAEALNLVKQADKASGLWAYWGKQIDDPYITTFNIEKSAERYIDGRLVKLSDLRKLDDGFLTEVMGTDSVKEMKTAEALDVFETLPRPIKSEIFNKLDEV